MTWAALSAIWNNKLTRILVPGLAAAAVLAVAVFLLRRGARKEVVREIQKMTHEAYLRTKERMLHAKPGDLDLSDREWLRKRSGR